MQTFLYQLTRIVFVALGRMPASVQSVSAALLGRLIYRLDGKHRRIALRNLGFAFGNEKSLSERETIARETFVNLVRLLFEIGWAMGRSREDIERRFSIRGLRHFIEAQKAGKGVLALTAHFGNWEVLAAMAAFLERPVNVLYRPLDAPFLDRFFYALRSRFGAVPVPTAKAMRRILTCLKRGETVAMLMDQNVDWYEGVFVDFFGKRACTNKGLARIACKTESPVVPVFLLRENGRFVIEFGPALTLIQTGDPVKDIEENTAVYNAVIEAFCRRYPDQWFWVHQRWKTPPAHPWPRIT